MSNLATGQDSLDLSGAPGADTALDDLFPNPETFGGIQPPPPPPPQAQVDAPFFYTYKTRDEAERGIREKDAFIEQLKQKVAKFEGQPPPVQPAPQAAPEPVNYSQDNKRYFRDIVEAVRKATETGDEEAYARVQQQFIYDTLGPAVPLFLDNARTNAVNRVEEVRPGVKEFLRSDDFAKVKEKYPTFAQAVQNAEGDFRYVASLPELYEMAYSAAQGLKVPELLKNATSSTSGTQGATPPPRPTLTNSTPAPPQPAGAVDLSTPEGRKAYIDAAKARGVDSIPIR